MIKRFLTFLIFSSLTAFAQSDDLAFQLRLIQVLLPESTRFGFVYATEDPNIDINLNIAINQTGLRAFKHQVTSIRDLAKGVRSLISRYEVDFIYVVDEDTVTSATALKALVSQCQRSGTPIFTLSANILDAGGYAQLFNDEGQWRMRIVGDSTDKYTISVPPNDDRFLVQ